MSAEPTPATLTGSKERMAGEERSPSPHPLSSATNVEEERRGQECPAEETRLEEQRLEEQRLEEERRVAAERAAEEKRAAEEHAVKERHLEEERLKEEQRLQEKRLEEETSAAAERRAAEERHAAEENATAECATEERTTVEHAAEEGAASQAGATGAPQLEAPSNDAGTDAVEGAHGSRQDPGPSRGPATGLGEQEGASWILEVTGGGSGRGAFFQAALEAAHLGLIKLGEESCPRGTSSRGGEGAPQGGVEALPRDYGSRPAGRGDRPRTPRRGSP